MKIKVTQENIDDAFRGLNFHSPISYACKDIWPGVQAAVLPTISEYWDSFDFLYLDNERAAEVPAVVTAKLVLFDAGMVIEPFEFEIKPPLSLRVKLFYRYHVWVISALGRRRA